jgi:hypothetical protein
MNDKHGEIYPYEQRYWYPHLSPAEAALWHKFVAKNPDAFKQVAYDVKVGTIPDFVMEQEDEAIRKQASLYRYKIDVVGFKDGKIAIIELKQSATFRAIGQVKAYGKLYARDIGNTLPVEYIIITDNLLPDMKELSDQEDVNIIVV